MIEMYAIAAVALIALGAVVGALLLYALGIRREDRAHSLGQADPGRIAGGLRAITRAYAHPRLPELTNRRADLALAGHRPATATRI